LVWGRGVSHKGAVPLGKGPEVYLEDGVRDRLGTTSGYEDPLPCYYQKFQALRMVNPGIRLALPSIRSKFFVRKELW
jgi:hypothetical protein